MKARSISLKELPKEGNLGEQETWELDGFGLRSESFRPKGFSKSFALNYLWQKKMKSAIVGLPSVH